MLYTMYIVLYVKEIKMEMTIKNKELASNLIALAIMCAHAGTNGCELTLKTSKGQVKCRIEFEDVEDENKN